MKRCLQLAQNGLGYVAPNPLVGAVIVHENKIIGEGFHHAFGQAHAEVEAIQHCKHPELLSQSTLYVNLEPCSHFGKTPPCADLIIANHIPRVVIANKDPFPEVAGKGIEKLKSAGVEVITGIAAHEGEELNRRFFTFHRKKRPYIILKWAQSADGFIDSITSVPAKISSAETDRLVHEWRTREQAILIGYNTALKDNPKLTARLYPGKNPLRIVWDKNLQLPEHLHLFSDGEPLWVINASKTENRGNTQYMQADTVEDIANRLYEHQIQSIIIEGGANTLQRWIDARLWDEARVITGNLSFGAGVRAPMLSEAGLYNRITVDSDIITTFRNTQNGNE